MYFGVYDLYIYVIIDLDYLTLETPVIVQNKYFIGVFDRK
jgi:hypothetical protein